MKYKGFYGFYDYIESLQCFHGRVCDTDEVITFYGNTEKEVEMEFKNSVDDYLEFKREKEYEI